MKKTTQIFLNKAFGFDPKKNSVKTEITAGFTTFLTMAYILAVNPDIFSHIDGMPRGSVFSATALAAVVGTLMMAFYAKKPFGLAPGMGLNAFFVYTVCLGMGYTWQFALTAVLIEGIIFVILSLTGLRTWLLKAIPGTLNKAIGAGIGMFIAFIGLQNAGIIVSSPATLVTLGDIMHGKALLAMIGLTITAGLVMAKVQGGILIGILITTLLGIFIKDPATGSAITTFTYNEAGKAMLVDVPQSVRPIFCQFEWSHVLSWDMLIVVMTFLFIDMFDTMGTIIGVSQGTDMAGKENKADIKDFDKMFLSDAVATVAGACLGTSTTTTFVESASGVGVGGRTGLTSFTTAICFAIALFFAPLFLAIPGAATAPALIIVGVMMMHNIKAIHWENLAKAIPAFVTIMTMPLAYSISDGILLGVIFYVLTHAIVGKFRSISPVMWVLAVIFILRYIFI